MLDEAGTLPTSRLEKQKRTRREKRSGLLEEPSLRKLCPSQSEADRPLPECLESLESFFLHTQLIAICIAACQTFLIGTSYLVFHVLRSRGAHAAVSECSDRVLRLHALRGELIAPLGARGRTWFLSFDETAPR